MKTLKVFYLLEGKAKVNQLITSTESPLDAVEAVLAKHEGQEITVLEIEEIKK